MKNSSTLVALLAVGVPVGLFATQAQAQPVVIDTVVVGNPGNPGEQSRLPNSDPTFYGDVANTFWMGQVRGDGQAVHRVPERRGGERIRRTLLHRSP